jgi:predicted PurR-regulated permease PerM
MYLIQNSRDLLNIVIAFCILWLTIFFAWFIYYLAMMMKQFFQIVKEMRGRLKKVDDTIDALKEKIEHSASYLSLIGEGVKKLVEVIREYGEKKGRKK